MHANTAAGVTSGKILLPDPSDKYFCRSPSTPKYFLRSYGGDAAAAGVGPRMGDGVGGNETISRDDSSSAASGEQSLEEEGEGDGAKSSDTRCPQCHTSIIKTINP